MKTIKPMLSILAIMFGAAVAVSAHAEETAPGKPPHGPRGGDRMFEESDTNKDGMLTKAEMLTAAQSRVEMMFEHMDTNKDGKVTKEEAQAAREKMRAQFKQHMGGPKGPQPAEAAPDGQAPKAN